VSALVALGQQALDEDRLTRPRDDSALGYFRGALALDPASAAARDGIDAIASRYVRLAEQRLAERDFRGARRYAERGLEVQPDHPGFSALSREAGRSLARLESLLAAGDRALYDRRLTTPTGNSALHYYDAALRMQPGNGRALDGKARIVGRYVALAEDRIEHYRYGDARELIRRGLEVDPRNPALLRLRRRAQPDQAPRQLIRDIRGLFD
jgi:tetratricopeptide (TPR) repeat protein